MQYLTGREKEEAMGFIRVAADVARNATCERSRCGSVIVKDGTVISKGWNSPPGGNESQRRCACDKSDYHVKVTDKTCCVHAEQRAIMDALQRNSEKLNDARLYFVRLGDDGEITFSDKPYCTICSKMALDAGIQEFVLYHEDGIAVYDTEEYNELSYGYAEWDARKA